MSPADRTPRKTTKSKQQRSGATAVKNTPAPSTGNAVERYFRISQRGSTVSREIRGGLVTFFTMAYIVVLNPLIIGTQADSTNHYIRGAASRAEAIPMVAAATALVAGVMTILMGV